MHNLLANKKAAKAANGCKWTFYQCQSQKYLQIWLLLKFLTYPKYAEFTDSLRKKKNN